MLGTAGWYLEILTGKAVNLVELSPKIGRTCSAASKKSNAVALSRPAERTVGQAAMENR